MLALNAMSNHTLSITTVSPCGTYIARVSSIEASLEIFRVPENPNAAVKDLYRSYGLNQEIENYVGKQKDRIRITQLKWEELDEATSTADKIALVIETYSLLLIYDIRKSTEPIVIEQSPEEGIEDFQWIPPPIGEKKQNEEVGAYTNSKQIALYTKNRLELKVYSVDCTHILFTIPKPVSLKPIIRPNLNNQIWSVIAEPYLEKNTNVMKVALADTKPIIYHFYNSGLQSQVLYQFRLPTQYLTLPSISWSPSSKWFMYFGEPLFGYSLQVYNLMGINHKSTKAFDHVGHAMLQLDWATENIQDHPVYFGSIKYISRWIKANESEKIDESIIISTKTEDGKIEIMIVSMESFKITCHWTLPDTPIENLWSQNNDTKYRKIFPLTPITLQDNKLHDVFTDAKGLVLFQFDFFIYIYKTTKGAKIEIEWQLVDVIQTQARILNIDYKEHNDQRKIFITTEDHIAVYDEITRLVRCIHTNKHKIKDVFIFQTGEKVKFIITDNTSSFPGSSVAHWHMTLFTIETEKSNVADNIKDFDRLNDGSSTIVSTNYEDDSNAEIMKKYQYKEDDSRVVGLMRDVQHSEWGQAARKRRSRISEGRLGILLRVYGRNQRNELTSDDITDTFNLNKRKSKN